MAGLEEWPPPRAAAPLAWRLAAQNSAYGPAAAEPFSEARPGGPARPPGRAGYGADMRRGGVAIAGALWKTCGMGLPDGVLRKVCRGDALDVIPGLDRSPFPAP